jgi:hypothetical protein
MRQRTSTALIALVRPVDCEARLIPIVLQQDYQPQHMIHTSFFKNGLLSVMIMASMAFIPSATAATVVNGGFEDVVMTGAALETVPAGQAIGAWEVINSSVLMLRSDYIEFYGGPVIPFFSHGGNQHLDITGHGNTGNAGVQQWIDTDPGSRYWLTFWIANMDDAIHSYYTKSSSIRLLVDGVDQGTFTNAEITTGGLNWKLFNHRFAAQNSSTLITFVSATVGDNMAGLDDVSVAHAPEPSTWGLMLSSGLVIAFARSRAWRAGRKQSIPNC